MKIRNALPFTLPLLIALSAIGLALGPFIEHLLLGWFARDLDLRSSLIAKAVERPLTEYELQGRREDTRRLLVATAEDERVAGLKFCPLDGPPIVIGQVPRDAACEAPPKEDRENGNYLTFLRLKAGNLYVIHDISFAQRRLRQASLWAFLVFLAVGVGISLIALWIANVSWRGWTSVLKRLISGERPNIPYALSLAQFGNSNMYREIKSLLRDANKRPTLPGAHSVAWDPALLRQILKSELSGDEIIAVSNREPYIHMKKDGKVEIQHPASGLVTSLEPVMRACSGTWVAHGSGNADKESADAEGRIGVPPEDPRYTLKRIWLSKEEEQGYYYGFANEGLWPLCHIAHQRPVFRASDWDAYERANRRFADAVIAEAKTQDPVVLVQDYHFALLPAMIREKLPEATIITFWHIPWPNSESFGICPYRKQILEGLLGSSIMGFHTQYHCNNFIEAVDRYLEARIDRESLTVYQKASLTSVNAYPISIEWPPMDGKGIPSTGDCTRLVREGLGLPHKHLLGVGVDRLDYTKGILEKFLAVEQLMELHPEWRGRFSFLQIAAPSRSAITAYQNFEKEVLAEAERINGKYREYGPPPIILNIRHHDAQEVFIHYRASQLCFVGSLHDGMNLVAKEYVAAREDGLGVLILSQFTGAARELHEALLVNPYDTRMCAMAMHHALNMPEEDVRERMSAMREQIASNNVFKWAGSMLLDAARIRKKNRVARQLTSPGLFGQGAWEG